MRPIDQEMRAAVGRLGVEVKLYQAVIGYPGVVEPIRATGDHLVVEVEL
jgi:hypothetical protein